MKSAGSGKEVFMRLIVRIGPALLLIVVTAGAGFSQVQVVQPVQVAQNRIPQQIIVNGQQVNGVYVPSPGGGMQSYTCPGPQEYTTPDGSSRGWTCFDYATGAWLLNAVPPAPQPVYVPAPQPVVQSAVVYQAPPPAVVYTQPATTVLYTEPAVRTVIVNRPVYPSSVYLGAAVINAAGRITAAAIRGSHQRVYYSYPYPVRGRHRY
jgi:hypothetical protein